MNEDFVVIFWRNGFEERKEAKLIQCRALLVINETGSRQNRRKDNIYEIIYSICRYELKRRKKGKKHESNDPKKFHKNMPNRDVYMLKEIKL